MLEEPRRERLAVQVSAPQCCAASCAHQALITLSTQLHKGDNACGCHVLPSDCPRVMQHGSFDTTSGLGGRAHRQPASGPNGTRLGCTSGPALPPGPRCCPASAACRMYLAASASASASNSLYLRTKAESGMYSHQAVRLCCSGAGDNIQGLMAITQRLHIHHSSISPGLSAGLMGTCA